MLDVKSSYERLTKAENFKAPGFLCGIFVMSSPELLEKADLQFDFYDKKKDKITSFTLGEKIKEVNSEADVFKEENTTVNELDLEEVKVSWQESLKKARTLLEHESESKIILVLQKSDVPFWNVSLLTTIFNLLNVKVNAQTGEVIEHKKVSLLSFKN